MVMLLTVVVGLSLRLLLSFHEGFVNKISHFFMRKILKYRPYEIQKFWLKIPRWIIEK